MSPSRREGDTGDGRSKSKTPIFVAISKFKVRIFKVFGIIYISVIWICLGFNAWDLISINTIILEYNLLPACPGSRACRDGYSGCDKAYFQGNGF
jgi:hypothetical protein